MPFLEKYGTARRARYDSIILRMRFAYWMTKATDTHSEYVIFIAFSTAKLVMRAPLIATFVRTLPVVSKIRMFMIYARCFVQC